MTPAPPYPSPVRARLAAAVLATVAMFGTMDEALLALVVEPMKRELGLSDVQVGLAHAAAFSIGYGLASIPAGLLADRVSRVQMLFAAVALWVTAMAVGGLTHSLTVLVATRLALGAAAATVYPAALSLISDYFEPERRAPATTSFGIGQIIGRALAALAGGFAFDAAARWVARDPDALFGLTPWRALFVGFAVFALILFPLLALIREPTRQEVGRVEAGTFRELWDYRAFLLPLFIGIAALIGMRQGVALWLPTALMRLYGQTPGQFAGWFSAVTLACGLFAAITAGRLAQIAIRRGRPESVMRPAAISMVFCVPGSFVAMTPSLPWLAAAYATFTACAGIAMMMVVIAINVKMPNELRGLTMGLEVVCAALAMSVTPPLTAWIGGLLGGDAMIGRAMAAVGATLAVVSALAFWKASRSPPSAGRLSA